MFSLPKGITVFVAIEPCDMRKQFDGLANVVRSSLRREPNSGDIFVFRNRRGNLLKMLFFDTQGFCLIAKRLDRSVFQWPKSEKESGCMDASALAKLLCEVK